MYNSSHHGALMHLKPINSPHAHQDAISTIPRHFFSPLHTNSPLLLRSSNDGLSSFEEVLQQPPLQGDWRPLGATPKALSFYLRGSDTAP